MEWQQTILTLSSKPSQSILVTSEILKACPSIRSIEVGFLHLFLRHTSASLTINENADAAVRHDLDMLLDHLVPEDLPYRHTDEGPDDMPAHGKAALLGTELQIPIGRGELLLGTWQGIYLCEHRSQSHQREIVCTVFGKEKK